MNTPNLFTIRAATVLDIPEASALHRAEHPDDQFAYADNIRYASTVNFVAELDGSVVGFVTVLTNPPNPDPNPRLALWHRMRPYVGFLVVAIEKRGLGVGQALTVAAAVMAMSRYRSDEIYLECRVANTSAQAMYEKLGFGRVAAEEVQALFGRPPHEGSLVYRGGRTVLAVKHTELFGS